MKYVQTLYRICLLLLFVNISNNCLAQELITKLNAGTVFDTKIESNGRIWIATNRGLILHDGINYIRIKPSQKKYQNQSVKSLCVYKHYLYAIFANSGAVKFDLDNFKSVEISNEAIENIVQYNNDHYYILFSDGKIEDHTNGKVKLLAKFKLGTEGKPIMTIGPKGSLLVSVPKIGLYQLNITDGKIAKDYGIIPTGFLNSFAHYKNRIFLINYWQVLELDSTGTFTRTDYISESINSGVTFLLPISDSSMIVVHNSKVIKFYDKDELVVMELDKLKNYDILNVSFFNKNNIYIGTNQGLLKAKNIERSVDPLYDTAIQTNQSVRVRRKILPYKNNRFFVFGTPYSYLYNPSDKSYKNISNKQATLYDAIVVEDNVFASSEGGGVAKINLTTKKLTNLTPKNFDTSKLYMALLDVHSVINQTILFGTRGRLVYYNYVANSVDTLSLHNIKARVRALVKDSATNIVYAGTEDGLYSVDLINKKLKKRIPTKGSFISDIKLAIYRGKQLIWVASDFGLEAYESYTNKLIFSVPISKLNNDKIAALLVDKNNNIWASTFSGVFIFNPYNQSLLDLSNDKWLVNNEYNYKSAAVLQDGRLIFGGLNGYDIFDPSKFNLNEKKVNGIVSGYSFFSNTDSSYYTYTPNNKIIYNSENNYIQLFLTIDKPEIIDYCNFEYKLDNLSWIPLKNETNIILFKLSDGAHVLTIRGRDDVGRVINFESISIDYRTPFIQTAYLNYLLLLFIFFLIILFGWSIYKKVEDENKLKEQIAMDLHDEIGTLLTKALHTVKLDGDNNEKNVKGLINNYISEALFSVRTYINAINFEYKTLHEFADEMSDFKSTYLTKSNIQFKINYHYDREYILSASNYRDLKLMFYEITQNVLKHSNSTNVIMNIDAKNYWLDIIHEDDGDLLDATTIEYKGNGISNLKKRAKRLGGTIQFLTPESGNGLQIKLKVKLY